MEHTPTPWKANGDFILHTSTGTHIATTMPAELPVTPQSVANAEYIVRACNAFPKLVEMIKDFASRIRDSEEWWMDWPDMGGFDLDAIEVFIALATPPVEPEKESTCP